MFKFNSVGLDKCEKMPDFLRRYTFIYKPVKRLPLFCWLLVSLLGPGVCSAQKYSFSHYDIEDGLIESQVRNFSSDNEHRLWMATYGGACRFDGREFTSFTRQNGLPTNFANTVFIDKKGLLWIGTPNGLVQIVNKKAINYPVPVKLKNQNVTAVIQDGYGTIWTIINYHLFALKRNTLQLQFFEDTVKHFTTCLAVDDSGRLFASVYKKGIYSLNAGKWDCVIPFAGKQRPLIIRKILFDRLNNHKLYLLTDTSIYSTHGASIQPYETTRIRSIHNVILCMQQDAFNNFWIGTTKGAYCIKKQELIHFTAVNGLTDNPVNDIYNDADNNLWFASEGSGFFKYDGDRVIVYDKTQGIPGKEVIMAITRDKDSHIILGIDGAGLMRYKGNKFVPIPLPAGDPFINRVQCLYTDKKGAIWIGTNQSGLWKYYNGRFKLVNRCDRQSINNISEDGNGLIWIITPTGCLYLENNVLKKVKNFTTFCSTILMAGKDSLYIGTDRGIRLIVNRRVVEGFKLNTLNTSAVYCMLKYKGMLLIGTDDRGLFTLDMKSGQMKNYSTMEGLQSNTVYSLVSDGNGSVWVATGRGVNVLTFKAGENIFKITNNHGSKDQVFEANQDAAIYNDHQIWIGTTKGVVVYNVKSDTAPSMPPHIVIQSVKLLAQKIDGRISKDTTLTDGAKLSFNQNHLSISFRGIYLKNPESIMYRYKLSGLDSIYSRPVRSDIIYYPSLPPGSYTFEIKAVTGDGLVSKDTAKFHFSIVPPFYQTTTFKALAVLFFILLGIALQSNWHRIKIKRQKVIEMVKKQENVRIRQQTAEDFHDELGNKLTRITVLSELLDDKLDQTKTDQKKLLEQIKQNASSLYNGTKDILWALDSQSDNLYDILNHIKDFGSDLFLDTAVKFEFNGISEALNRVKLPMEYSRNLPLIFKELLNNILKHANAMHVTLNLENIQKDELTLRLTDNGDGFDQEHQRKGQGIGNITMRSKRIGGIICINSVKGEGTVVTLKIKINNMQ